MSTGRIDYSPDYKSEKRDYTDGGRLPTIKEMSGSINFGGRVVFDGDEQRVVSADELERERLRDAVVEKCSAYCASVLDMEENGKPKGMTYNDWHIQHSDKQDAMIDAYKALIQFQSLQEKKD